MCIRHDEYEFLIPTTQYEIKTYCYFYDNTRCVVARYLFVEVYSYCLGCLHYVGISITERRKICKKKPLRSWGEVQWQKH